MGASKIRFIVIAGLVILWAGLVTYKVVVLKFHPRMTVPVNMYDVKLAIDLDGHGGDISVRTFVPTNDSRQEITESRYEFEGLDTALQQSPPNQLVEWKGTKVAEHKSIRAYWTIRSRTTVFKLPATIPIVEKFQDSLAQWLLPTELIQSESEEIRSLANRIGITKTMNAVEAVKIAYHFASDSLRSASFSARTDALLALKLGEASCNGKSRLMVALLRNRGIPARPVGGIILENGNKRTTHQWVEVFLGTSWVSFCPLNHYYAKIPDTYLTFYRGDESLFLRSANINFKYIYEINQKQIAREYGNNPIRASLFNVLNLWKLFMDAGIPVEFLRILLMVPMGAVIIIIFRNVIGVHTFGIFLPVLIATAYRDSGLLFGTIIFCSAIVTGIIARQTLIGLRLLHSPRLTIILVSVIVTLIVVTTIGIFTGSRQLFAASIFPLAIISITVERFCTHWESSGLKKSLEILFWTLLVVAACYVSMLSVFLQSVVMTFPETLLLVVAVSIYLGSWNHLRLMEVFRFRKLIFDRNRATIA